VKAPGTPGGCDLHAHTTASDGVLAPADLLDLARRVGLEAVGVTDHDTLDGLAEAEAAGARLGVRVVPGVEVNTQEGGREVHVLGYFCGGGDALRGVFDGQRRSRAERMARMVERLRRRGLPVTLEAVEREARGAVLCRPHLARVLVAAGCAASEAEAFARYLRRGAPGYVPRPRLAPAEAVAAIRADGGVAVLAHPGLIGDDGVLERLVPAGLGGVEAYHSDHTPEQARRYAEAAARHGLVATGGSDFHGTGRHGELGDVRVGPEVVRALEERAGRRAPSAPSAGPPRGARGCAY
jgi:predicted metal-dependent phosphoesterase TrpH